MLSNRKKVCTLKTVLRILNNKDNFHPTKISFYNSQKNILLIMYPIFQCAMTVKIIIYEQTTKSAGNLPFIVRTAMWYFNLVYS